MAYPRVPKLKVPFQIVGKAAAAVEQNSDDEIFQCVEAIVRTPEGTRIDEPEFGIPDYAFQREVDEDQIVNSISEWEPRAETIVDAEQLAGFAVEVHVDVVRKEERGG